jgi:hypothetical protein
MLRLLIEDVTLTKGDTLHADIRFVGGATRSLDLPLPKSCVELRTTDAAVVKEVEKHASLKRWAGHPLFIYAAVRTWASKYDRKNPHFEVTFAEDDRVPDGYFTVVLNTNPYPYLGNRPLDLSPAATLDRGLVAITFRTMKAGAILKSLGGALRGGGVKPTDYLDVHTDVDALTVSHHQPFPYQLDGDYLGETTTLDFEHVRNAVRLVRPNITADHGYATSAQFATTLEDDQVVTDLKNTFSAQRLCPATVPWTRPVIPPVVLTANGYHVVTGQVKWRIQSGFPPRCHGGLTLLEVGVPWVELPPL